VCLQGPVGDRLGGVDLGLAGGELELGVLERGHGLAEDVPFLGVRLANSTAAAAWA